MGKSAGAQICYGVVFEEGYEFPWDCDEYGHDYDIEEWWLKTVVKFKPSVELYAGDGSYLDGRIPTGDEVDRYFNEKWAALEKDPVPVKQVNFCTFDDPVYILAIPSTYFVSYYFNPVSFEPENLQVNEHKRQALLAFCKRFGLEYSAGPAWYLSSFYG